MGQYYSNYPPGVSTLPGDFDKTVSFTVKFMYIFECDNVELMLSDIPSVVRKFLGRNDVDIDVNTINFDSDYCSVEVVCSEELDMDIRDMDDDEIRNTLFWYINHTMFDSGEVYLDSGNADLEYRII